MHIARFSTDRFLIDSWLPLTEDPQARRALVATLATILTPKELAHLLGSLHLGPDGSAVSDWVDARTAKSDVLSVQSKADMRLVGLIILASDHDERDRPTIHLGYLVAESVWGQGAASEIVKGLFSSLRKAAPLRLVGGVDTGNPASARVLQKAGFTLDPLLSRPVSETYTLDIE